MAEAEKSHRIVSGKERRERIATAVLAVLGGIEDLTGEEKIRHAVDLADGLILELDKA
jgi:hypothetical protein